MAWIQSKGSTTGAGTAATLAVTLDNAVKVGQTIIVTSNDNWGTLNTISTMTDDLGNQYNRVASATESSFVDGEMWAASVTVAGIPTITAAYSGHLVNAALLAATRDDIAITSPKDASVGASAITGTALSSGATGATIQDNEIVIGAGFSNGISSTHFSAGGGFGNLVEFNDGAASGCINGLEDSVISSKAAQTATMTSTTSGHWIMLCGTFKVFNTAPAASLRIPNRNVGPMALRRVFRQPYYPTPVDAPSGAVNASIAQIAATVTATGGTQIVATINNVAITQTAGVVTAAGGTQVIAATVIASASVAQVAGVVTATGGTQTVASVQIVAITQVAANVTASGGTQSIATVNNVTITQLAATVTATGGTQTVGTVNIVAIAQVAAVVTASGGTQDVSANVFLSVAITQIAANVTATGGTQAAASSQVVSLTQVAANVAAAGGTQAIDTVNIVAINQVAGIVTATGGTQSVANTSNVAITQVAANVTATGGTQVISISASVAQAAASVTATGGVQAIFSFSSAAITQAAANVIATGGTQIISTATGPLPPRRLYIDSDANIYLVINQNAGLVEKL